MPSLEVGNQGCEESQRELQETRERFRWKAQRAERRGKEAGLTHLRGRGSSGARTLGNKFATAGGAGVGSKDLTGLAKEFEVWIHFLSLQTQVGPNVAAEHNTRLVSVPEARSSVGLPGISAPSVRGRNERAGGVACLSGAEESIFQAHPDGGQNAARGGVPKPAAQGAYNSSPFPRWLLACHSQLLRASPIARPQSRQHGIQSFS